MTKIIDILPESWAEIELIKCFSDSLGGANILSAEYREAGIPIILKSDVQPMCATTQPTKFVPQIIVKTKYPTRAVVRDDLLLCMRDLSQKAQILGLISTCTEEQIGYLVAQGVTLLRGCLVDRQFVSYFSNIKQYRDYIFRVKRGSTQVHLGNDDIFLLALPLPPLGEQKRIVAKIESTQEKIKTIEQSVTKAEELIGKYREALLQKAFRGELVPQDPKDEPASKLLERIRADRAKQTDGKKKKKDDLPPIKPEEIPFEIPKSWEWVRLGDLIENIEAGWSPQCESHPRNADNWGVLKISAVTWGCFNPNENKALPKKLKPKPQFEVCNGDFIVSRANTLELVGRGVVVTDCPPHLMLNDKLLRIRFAADVSPDFYCLVNNCFIGRTYYEEVASGTSSSMRNITREELRLMIVPLPPATEQTKIIERIGSMNLSSKITVDTIQKIEKILMDCSNSILQAAFSGRLVPQNPSEGTGHELLEKIKSQAALADNNKKPTVKSKNKIRAKK